jgi:acetyl-CoA carboxylase biotin carboxyl carrier protein
MKTVAEESLTYAELLQILELIKSTSQFSEIHLKFGDIEIDLSRAATQLSCGATASMSRTAALPRSAAISTGVTRGAEQLPPVAAGGGRPEPTPAWPANSVLVRSPTVGTFYRAPSPGAPPFVEVGQTVEADLCRRDSPPSATCTRSYSSPPLRNLRKSTSNTCVAVP